MAEIFSKNDWIMIWNYKDTFILGFLNTLETAVVGIVLSLIIGIIIGLMGTSYNKFFRMINRIYVEVIQNTPLLLQLCVFYYIFAKS